MCDHRQQRSFLVSPSVAFTLAPGAAFARPNGGENKGELYDVLSLCRLVDSQVDINVSEKQSPSSRTDDRLDMSKRS